MARPPLKSATGAAGAIHQKRLPQTNAILGTLPQTNAQYLISFIGLKATVVVQEYRRRDRARRTTTRLLEVYGVAHLYRSFIAILCRSFPVAIALSVNAHVGMA